MVYKSLNGLAPSYLRSKFTDRGSVTNYFLRDTNGKLAINWFFLSYVVEITSSANTKTLRFSLSVNSGLRNIQHAASRLST